MIDEDLDGWFAREQSGASRKAARDDQRSERRSVRASSAGEWTKPSHLGTFNTDVLHARFVTHRFARHTHSEFVVAYVEAGVEAHYFRGQTIHVPAQRVVVVNPDEPHMGCSSSAEGFTYRVLYPPVALLQRIATELAGRRSPAAVYFREPVCADARVVEAQREVHSAIAYHASRLEIEERFVTAMSVLVERGARFYASQPAPLSRLPSAGVRRARELLEEHFREDVPLAHLANACGTSMYHLQRAFRRAWGLSPHEFQSQLRVYHARALLQVGTALNDVATEVGFFDQSHLNRHFKRILGITPGQYRHSAVSPR